jgi:hypothetical protein
MLHREWDRPFPSPREAAEQIAAIRKETKMATLNVDMAKVNAMYQAGLSKHQAEAADKLAKTGQKLGVANFGGFEAVGSISSTFCDAAESVNKIINTALYFAGFWFSKDDIGMVKSWVATINSQFVDPMCKVAAAAPPPAPAQPDPMHRGPQGGGGN